MKTLVISTICLLAAVLVFGQEPELTKKLVSEPQFSGIDNFLEIQSQSANTLIGNYLLNEIIYPEKALICHIEGTEVVQFSITTTGNISDIKIINSVCPAIDDEIILVLKGTNGMWIPGEKEGKPVEMTKEVSLIFNVASNSKESAKEIFTAKAENYFIKGNKELYRKSNIKKALNYYSKGLNYLPYDQSLLSARGLCLYELGDRESAYTDWNRLAKYGNADLNKITDEMEKLKGYSEMLAILGK